MSEQELIRELIVEVSMSIECCEKLRLKDIIMDEDPKYYDERINLLRSKLDKLNMKIKVV